ncbi:MAG: metallophosphoesterase [Schwartzia sp. (in: firmicutes)]
MLIFWLILLTVLAAVAALAWWGLGAVAEGGRLTAYRRWLLLFDVTSPLLLIFGSHLVSWPDWLARLALMFLSGAFMAQLLFGVLAALFRGVRRLLQRPATPQDLERRRLLQGAAAIPLFAGGSSMYGVTAGRTSTVVREFSVPLLGIGAEMEGFRVAQLSDVHLGLFFSLDDLTALLEETASLGVDALLITGDLFDDDAMNVAAVERVDAFVERFPQGIWFCYGNHEYFRNINRTKQALAKSRIRVLANDHVRVVKGVRPLYFAGVDYPFPRAEFDALRVRYTADAMRGIPEGAVTIFLAHHPDFIDDAARYGAALVLTGHTHGGQIGVFGVPLVPPVFKYMRGLYRVGDTMGYVHCGNGSWFPYRLGCPPEIAVFRLEKKG